MTPDQWAYLKLLFEQASSLPGTERAELVVGVKSRDSEVASQLVALLAAHDQATQSAELLAFKDPARPFDRLLSDGEVILGRFEIVRLLGVGGMGEVYEARDREMGRIALKTVRGDDYSKEQNITRLREEVAIARAIASPHICRLYEFFPIPAQSPRAGFACFTMEFLDGETITTYIRQHGALAWSETKTFALQICAGLTAIHDAGVIHRDLKSNNIMLTPRGERLQAVVMDFGLARKPHAAAASVSSGSGSSFQGLVVGTPEYMAPEQFEGGEVSPATDIYAFGVLLYEMLAGKHPFKASSPIAAAVQRGRQLDSVSSTRIDVPPHVDKVIQKCLQYDPAKRFQSAAALADALNEVPAEARRGKRRVQRAAIAAAVGIVAVTAFFVVRWDWSSPSMSPDAKHWYEKGMASLHEGSYLTASSAFETALTHDPNFALAHARLAEAWSELDFKARAEHELLLASSSDSIRDLDHLDHAYLNAIQHSVTEDFQQASKDYNGILSDLPSSEKGIGYLDLARAYERADNIPEAVKNYSQAAAMPPASPAPFLRRAILEGRENNLRAADKDFTVAESLYRNAQNFEGLAEVNYQRGYIDNLHSHFAEARGLFQTSLQTAQEMHSAQLEIRALTGLALAAYGESNDAEAIRLANKAIDIAQDKHLDYWAIDARIRAGNAYLDKDDLTQADAQLSKALELARENRSSRLIALANQSFAILREQQDKPSETISYASDALSYYQKVHRVNESFTCLALITRAKLLKCQYSDALQSGSQLLELARKSDNAANIYLAEELVGSAKLALQDYPGALQHYQAALAASRQTGQQVDDELVNCAEALWQLGRYGESEGLLNSIPAKSLEAAGLAHNRANVLAFIRLSQQDFKAALNFANQSAASAKTLAPFHAVEAKVIVLEASAQLGLTQASRQTYEELRVAPTKLDDAALSAKFDYASAVMFNQTGQFPAAKSAALNALRFATTANQPESKWRTYALLSDISSRSGDVTAAQENSTKALDILASLEHTWGTQIYATYLTRPDIRKEWLRVSSSVRRK